MAKFNTLLLTSDNGIAQVLSMFLKQQGSNTSICSDMEEAIHMMQNGNYGLVIVDEDTSAASILQNYTNGAQFVFIGDETMKQYVGNTITKPFKLNQLLKYVKNVENDIRFRNTEMDAAQDVPDDEEGNQIVKPDVTANIGGVMEIGELKFEPSTRNLVTKDGRMFKIPSEVQCEILKTLAQNGLNTPVNYETIFNRIDNVSPKADGSKRTLTNIADRKTLQNIVKKMRGYLIPNGIDFRSTGNGYALVEVDNQPLAEPMNESKLDRIVSRIVNESLKRIVNEKVRYDWLDDAMSRQNFNDDVPYDNDLDYETVYYEALHFISENPKLSQSWREIANGIGFRMETVGRNDMETVKDAIEDAMADSE